MYVGKHVQHDQSKALGMARALLAYPTRLDRLEKRSTLLDTLGDVIEKVRCF